MENKWGERKIEENRSLREIILFLQKNNYEVEGWQNRPEVARENGKYKQREEKWCLRETKQKQIWENQQVYLQEQRPGWLYVNWKLIPYIMWREGGS